MENSYESMNFCLNFTKKFTFYSHVNPYNADIIEKKKGI
jgi:hypothetical protein